MGKITYDELKLGEKLKEIILAGGNPEGLPCYLNTRKVIGSLNATDAVIAAVLSGLNISLVGGPGTGKTQLAKDIYNYYFGGNYEEKGNGIWMKGRPDLDVHSEIFTKLNMKEGSFELTDNIKALIFAVDEFNRCPPISQNQFLGMGDRAMDHRGRSIALGRDGYCLLLTTANLGNGEFSGTFESDKGLDNRLHIAIDFNYEMFKPTLEDEIMIDDLKAADPRVKDSRKRDISGKIIAANKEIEEIARQPGWKVNAVINYLRFGLDNCQKYSRKEKVWPLACSACGNAAEKEGKTAKPSLCSLITAPVRRTVNATIRYAAALHYLSKLKDPNEEIDTFELAFKAFEICGAYQHLLNPAVLRQDYNDQNPKMMRDVVERLQKDFNENIWYLGAAMKAAEHGQECTAFYQRDDSKGIYDMLSEEAKKKTAKIEPFHNKRSVGMEWVKPVCEIKRRKR